MLKATTAFEDPHLESLLTALESNRRGFMAAATTVGFALAVGPVNAQAVIRTSADDGWTHMLAWFKAHGVA